MWNALKKFFSKLFIRLNDRYKEVDPYSVEGLALADMRDNVVKPIRDIFFEGAKKIAEHNKAKVETKSENTVEADFVSDEKDISKGKIAIDTTNKSPTKNADIRHSSRYTEYNKPITIEDIETLRSIGRKSINDFTSEEIEKSQKWAYKFSQELGTKSPFFRAWFGDWRSNEINTKQETIKVNPLAISSKIDAINYVKSGLKNHSLFRGDVKNTDTDFKINIGSHVYNDTLTYASRELSRRNDIQKFTDKITLLSRIKEIVEKSILLDSATINDKDSADRTFMHYFYSVANVQGRAYLVKLGVDEINANYGTIRRAYNVDNIKISPIAVSQVYKPADTIGDGGDILSTVSISNLFSLVKQYDKEFSPKTVNPILLNEDGTPKVFYHGTDAKFTEFSVDEISAREGSFFFAENKMDAVAYGKNVFEVYLRGENLADYDNQPSEFYKLKTKREQVEWLKDRDYDGWYADMDSDGWGELSVFSPEQIKSATDNVGTFDRGSKDIRHKSRTVTAEQDTAYLDAIKRGDLDAAQKMVDEVAKANGYTVKGYHATNAEFNVFDISKTSDINYHGRGIYFTNSKRDVENNYENYQGPDPWQKIEAAAYELLYDKYNLSYEDTLTSDSEIIDKLNECYDEVIDKFKKTLRRVTAYLKFDNPLIIGKGERASDYDLSKYDGIIDNHVYENIGHGGMDENTVHYVVLNPSNIKSADAITYDDNGNVIPLSERFNTARKDIRYKVRNIVGNSGKNYGKGVYLDSSLLSGLTDEERVQMVKEYIKELGGSVFTAYDSNNEKVDIHLVESNRKFKNEKGKKVPVNQHLKNYLNNPIKQEAIALVNELILTANYSASEIARHKHGWLDADGKNTWDVWTTYLQDKENTVWKANLQIANSVNGEKILYEIHPIEKVEGVEKIDTASTTISISPNSKNVNTESKIRSKSRTSYTSGQVAQMKANLSHQKVYTKTSAMQLVNELAPKIRNRSFEVLADELWQGLNTFTSLDDKRTFASDMAEMFIDRMMVDTLVKNDEWDEAVEKMAYIRHGMSYLADMYPTEAMKIHCISCKF